VCDAEPLAGQRVLLGTVRALLSHGADADLVDDDGCSPLETAVQAGNDRVVNILLDHEIDEMPDYE
jgi:ankyrin repeat protein